MKYVKFYEGNKSGVKNLLYISFHQLKNQAIFLLEQIAQTDITNATVGQFLANAHEIEIGCKRTVANRVPN